SSDLVWVPLDPAQPPDRLRFQVEDCGASILISRTDLAVSLEVGEGLTAVLLHRAGERTAAPPAPPRGFPRGRRGPHPGPARPRRRVDRRRPRPSARPLCTAGEPRLHHLYVRLDGTPEGSRRRAPPARGLRRHRDRSAPVSPLPAPGAAPA